MMEFGCIFHEQLRVFFIEKEARSSSTEKSSTDSRSNILVKIYIWQAEKTSTDIPKSRRTERFKLEGGGECEVQIAQYVVSVVHFWV